MPWKKSKKDETVFNVRVMGMTTPFISGTLIDNGPDVLVVAHRKFRPKLYRQILIPKSNVIAYQIDADNTIGVYLRPARGEILAYTGTIGSEYDGNFMVVDLGDDDFAFIASDAVEAESKDEDEEFEDEDEEEEEEEEEDDEPAPFASPARRTRAKRSRMMLEAEDEDDEEDEEDEEDDYEDEKPKKKKGGKKKKD